VPAQKMPLLPKRKALPDFQRQPFICTYLMNTFAAQCIKIQSVPVHWANYCDHSHLGAQAHAYEV